MKKLDLPEKSATESFMACIESVADESLNAQYKTCLSEIDNQGTQYIAQANVGQLYTLPHTNHPRGTDPLILGSLKKSDLTKLYTYRMLQKQPAKSIYDEIMVAAHGKCPFCGGIGHPETLDHYLAKSNYPQFSVLPANLVPACRDCNTGKGHIRAQNAEEQVIHPYFDDNKFFVEKWISAQVIHSSPIVIEYFTAPPRPLVRNRCGTCLYTF
ncbi:Putative phage protein (fragment) [Candidatus Terasakiella magnetica]|uniref:Phage protein n=1 Tax=Candidatus Terasakiella magnetica TaxID=1867952 RepID=A0A1C3RHI9_9PROT